MSINLKDIYKDKAMIRKRILASFVFILFGFFILIARYYYLQVYKYEFYKNISDKNRIQEVPIIPNRGLIFDRNGVVLANNKTQFNLSITKEYALNTERVLSLLQNILNLTDSELNLMKKRLKKTVRPFESIVIMSDLSEKQVALFKSHQHKLQGFQIEIQNSRNYLFDNLFSHSIGYVGRISADDFQNIDKNIYKGFKYIGKTGVEKFYESQLRGISGFEEVEVNALGRVLRVLNKQEAQKGNDLTLTIDSRLQKISENLLEGYKGSVVVLEPKTGDILALVSKPGFNPNLFVNGISHTQYKSLMEDKDNPLYNRASKGLYPPGSIIKPMIAVAGLDSGVITNKSKIYDKGYYQLAGSSHQYRNWNRYGDGWIDFYKALSRSNDVFFYDLAHKLGLEKMHYYLTKFGIGRKISLDVVDEHSGLMPSKEWKERRFRQVWYPGETLILGIGQGYMQATPLQLAQAISLIANKGIWIRPHLAKRIGLNDVVDLYPPENIQLKDKSYWNDVIQGMEEVVHGLRGTARRIGLDIEYKIAGKSGTAQVVTIKQGESYNRDLLSIEHRDHALFAGFAPLDNPKIVVAVVVENGESGSRVAGPIMRTIMDAYLLDKYTN